MVTDAQRADFRKYLEDAGVIKALTRALLKLFELKNHRPESAISFVQQYLSENTPSMAEYNVLQNELKEMKQKLTKSQKKQKTIDSSSRSESMIRSGSLISARQSELMISERKTAKVHNKPKTPKSELELVVSFLNNPKSQSLLKKYLTREMYDKLKYVKTSYGTKLIDCINSGLQNHHSSIGVYIIESGVYDTFAELIDPIIEDYHTGFTSEMIHPELEWGDPSIFKCLDPENKYISSTRIRCNRSIAGYPLTPLMSEQNFLDLMVRVEDALTNLEGEVGDWYVLEGMDAQTKQQMIDYGYILENYVFLQDAAATNYWPKGRAFFMNRDRTIFIWVNEEDHLRFISIDVGSDFGNIYNRIINVVEQCSKKMEFVRHERFGWLSLCPTNLGCTIRASVMISLPKLTSADKLDKLVAERNLEIRTKYYDDNGTCEISNKRKLGLTEIQSIKEMYDGIAQIIAEEKSLE